LLALARAPAALAWAALRHDPGAVLLVLRQTARSPAPSEPSFPSRLGDPTILDGALCFLRESGQPTAGFVDWNEPAVQPIYRASLTYAGLAARVAEQTGRCDAEQAWVAGLLAPLGWLAVCATDAGRAADCLADPALARHTAATQRRHWGLDHAALARRLARAWNLPGWLSAVVGHLGLSAGVAGPLGADVPLFQVVQLAVGLAQQRPGGLFLAVADAPAQVAMALGLSAVERAALEREAEALAKPPPPQTWTDPGGVPLLAGLLTLARENRRLQDAPDREDLERRCDHLHQALEAQHGAEAERLQAQKLAALAEFAAGAGHEINNPLAVISGQAQYLLKQFSIGDEEPSASKIETSLRTIIAQAQRIHQMLNEVMQFARPPKPQRQLVDVPQLLRDVAAGLDEAARERGVELVCPPPEVPVTLFADVRQLRTALSCLLRNAIEAAPAGGWAGVRLERPAPDLVEFVVEDSGSGPAPALRAHLFDPFYSGRPAGRGRGLGLPTAWRLAREQGGDVRFDEHAPGPTRFILSLPLDAGPAAGRTVA
jgi:signal transduction histidine kinase